LRPSDSFAAKGASGRVEEATREIDRESRDLVGYVGRVSVRHCKEQPPTDAREALEEFLLALEVANFDDRAAMIYGDVRWSLARHREPIGSLDTLIGSHATSLDAILVTHHTAEFFRIKGLKIDDWIAH